MHFSAKNKNNVFHKKINNVWKQTIIVKFTATCAWVGFSNIFKFVKL